MYELSPDRIPLKEPGIRTNAHNSPFSEILVITLNNRSEPDIPGNKRPETISKFSGFS